MLVAGFDISDNLTQVRTSRLFQFGIYLNAFLIRFRTDPWLGVDSLSQHPRLYESRTRRNYCMRNLGGQDRRYVFHYTYCLVFGWYEYGTMIDGPLKHQNKYGANSWSHVLPPVSSIPIVLYCM